MFLGGRRATNAISPPPYQPFTASNVLQRPLTILLGAGNRARNRLGTSTTPELGFSTAFLVPATITRASTRGTRLPYDIELAAAAISSPIESVIASAILSLNHPLHHSTDPETDTMPADRKRPLPSEAPAQASQAKKRKTEPQQKYYAVRAGMTPGVYLTWKDCQEQTAGFKGASYKSFTSLEDAKAFVAGKKVKSAASKDEPPRFYAVARGAFTGIFNDWDQASLAIKGQKGPKYKKFETRAEAVSFIKQWGDAAAVAALGEEAAGDEDDDEEEDEDDDEEEDELEVVAKSQLKTAKKGPEPKLLIVYTDGCSLKNGKADAVAGVGVFFGYNDPRNYSEPLAGDQQTNQRAELTAILHALSAVPARQGLCIRSDSKYSINCATTWADGWEKKGWKTSGGDEVKNQDLVRAMRARLREREATGATTKFEWVKGHSSDLLNAEADRLANAGARKWWGGSK